MTAIAPRALVYPQVDEAKREGLQPRRPGCRLVIKPLKLTADDKVFEQDDRGSSREPGQAGVPTGPGAGTPMGLG
jgi:hypothetical protein